MRRSRGLPRTSGLTGSDEAYLASATNVEAVERFAHKVRNSGIDIVPFFIFNGKVTVSGAHEVKVLLEAMEMAMKSEAAVAQLAE